MLPAEMMSTMPAAMKPPDTKTKVALHKTAGSTHSTPRTMKMIPAMSDSFMAAVTHKLAAASLWVTAAMNESDIAGIIFIVLGVLCVLPAVLWSATFVFVSGGFIAAGIVLIISAGNMCRAKQDITPKKNVVFAELSVKEPAKKVTAPSLAKMPA